MDRTKWMLVFGFCLLVLLEISEGRRCYSNRGGTYHRCDHKEKCCSSESYPCCDMDYLETPVIIGIVVGVVIFVVFVVITIVCIYLLFRASKRKRSVVTSTTTTVIPPTTQTFQRTNYTQAYGMTQGQGQMYPPPSQPKPSAFGDPVYPPPAPTYT